MITCATSHVEKLDISLAASDGGTSLRWSRTYTGLSEQGNRFVEQYCRDSFHANMSFLARSMAHYLRSGELLKRAPVPRIGARS